MLSIVSCACQSQEEAYAFNFFLASYSDLAAKVKRAEKEVKDAQAAQQPLATRLNEIKRRIEDLVRASNDGFVSFGERAYLISCLLFAAWLALIVGGSRNPTALPFFSKSTTIVRPRLDRRLPWLRPRRSLLRLKRRSRLKKRSQTITKLSARKCDSIRFLSQCLGRPRQVFNATGEATD